MWTPRRIVLLSLCFFAVSALYLGYAYSAVGGIDGLPPLPAIYLPGDTRVELVNVVERKSLLAAAIRQAFGDKAAELDHSIRLALPTKNMVLTAGDFAVEPDGRVRLNPVSLAMFKKARTENGHPEITTVNAKVAWITFDRPVTTFSEIATRKIVEAELNGEVDVRNNRGRKDRDEDLHLRVKDGPIYYREDTHQIWTNSPIEVTDHRAKPKPHTINGKGMRMELLTESPQPPARGQAAATRKQPQKESIAGVKWITLQSGVKMVIQLDGNNGFLAGGAPPPSKEPAKGEKPRERSELTIKTPGTFRYDVGKDKECDVARFDDVVTGAGPTAGSPKDVEVDRLHQNNNKPDWLKCQHLTLKLRRKDNANPKAEKKPDGAGENVEVESAEATSSPGRYVTMHSETDGLDVTDSTYFFHDAKKLKTTIKSGAVPVKVTYKTDTKIEAIELEIQDVKPPVPPLWKAGVPLPVSARPYQRVRAKGPGWVTLVEAVEKGPKSDKAEKRNVKATWKDVLTSDRDGTQDVLTLTGDAKFNDLETQQFLEGDTLKVWLDAPEQVKSQPAAGGVASSRKPREVHAIGNVTSRSKEFNIHDTGKLIVKFTDVPAAKHLPPGGTVAPKKDEKAIAPKKDDKPAAPAARQPMPWETPKAPATPAMATTALVAGPELKSPPAEAPARPFDLSAREVEAKVERSPIKSTIDELYCRGQVKVRQDPAKADEKGTDVNGDTLKMTALAEGGYHLIVLGGGDENDLAELRTDKIYICGPEVNVHQGSNKVWVVGEGAMKMDSATNFQGDRLKEPVPMIVHWDKNMLFDGASAHFVGNIQATQQTGRLACQHLEAIFDRVISLKEGNKANSPAKVKKMICDKDVRVEDVTRDPLDARKVVKYQSLRCVWTTVDSLDPDEEKPAAKADSHRVKASGPGTCSTWEQGSGADLEIKGMDNAPAQKKPAAKKPSEPEFKMTVVSFERLMDANGQTNVANFYQNVRVLSLPWPKHDKPLDVEQTLLLPLPEGALYLRCEHLRVLDTPADAKTKRPANKEMIATENVYVQGKEFHAHAKKVTYNQQKQQVILHGDKDSPATMIRRKGQGAEPETIVGTKITYNRGDGKTTVEGVNNVQGQTAPGSGRK